MNKALVRFGDGRMVTGEVLKERVHEWEEPCGFLWLKSRTKKEKQLLVGYWYTEVNDNGVEVTKNYFSKWFGENWVVKVFETNE